ncbi:hypothetical protein B0H16DRAFT_1525151, partial [Mycena metata]
FSNWTERRQIVACMRGRIADLATNCYGDCVPQKALDCKEEEEEEEVCMLIVPELLRGDPATMLVNNSRSSRGSHQRRRLCEVRRAMDAGSDPSSQR